jgi:hypothetical protein
VVVVDGMCQEREGGFSVRGVSICRGERTSHATTQTSKDSHRSPCLLPWLIRWVAPPNSDSNQATSHPDPARIDHFVIFYGYVVLYMCIYL